MEFAQFRDLAARARWKVLELGKKKIRWKRHERVDWSELHHDQCIQRGSKLLPEINASQVRGIGPELTYFSISQYKR